MSALQQEVPAGIALSLDERRLHLILMPTERCNLRCSYCYEDFKHGHMHREVIDGIKKLISSRANKIDYLEIGWFGGEPLLNVNIISEISLHIRELQRTAGFRYFANMTTNGVLLSKAVFEQLLEFGVTNFQISLDGTSDIHDRTRAFKNGMGSFKKIWNNLLQIKETVGSFNIVLRVHVMRQNARDIENAIQNIRDCFGDDERFLIYLKSIEHLGSANDENIDLLDAESFDDLKKKIKRNVANEYALPHDGSGQYICYAARANSFIIRSNGNIGKCTVALYDDRNNLGAIDADGGMAIHLEKFRAWIDGLISHDQVALSCPLSAMNLAAPPPTPVQFRKRLPSADHQF